MKKIILAGLIALSLSPLSLKGQKLFTVDIQGKGHPMILIPGLYCNGKVWNETVDHYRNTYECYVITLAGFGGNAPALTDNYLEQVKNELIEYVRQKKLNHPVILGHSLGGFLAFWTASSAPSLFSGIIAVDGLPFLPGIQRPGATVESSKAMAENMRNIMGNQTPEMTKASQKMYLPMMITDTTKMKFVAEMATQSDSKTIGEAMYELYTTDLRPEVSKIQCPVQLQGSWIGYKDYGATHATALKSYQEQVASIKKVSVEINDTAKHFIFYDDPTWFYSKTDAFLKTL
jgi:pimeloyl-ACP methyl ester carboxylesterase